jgi:hypothetical protein
MVIGLLPLQVPGERMNNNGEQYIIQSRSRWRTMKGLMLKRHEQNESWNALLFAIREFCAKPTREQAKVMHDLEYILLGSCEYTGSLADACGIETE